MTSEVLLPLPFNIFLNIGFFFVFKYLRYSCHDEGLVNIVSLKFYIFIFYFQPQLIKTILTFRFFLKKKNLMVNTKNVVFKKHILHNILVLERICLKLQHYSCRYNRNE